MAGITLAQAQAQLDLYLAAETAVMSGQRYKIGERELWRADLGAIHEGIKIWDARVKYLSERASGRGRSRTVICSSGSR